MPQVVLLKKKISRILRVRHKIYNKYYYRDYKIMIFGLIYLAHSAPLLGSGLYLLRSCISLSVCMEYTTSAPLVLNMVT